MNLLFGRWIVKTGRHDGTELPWMVAGRFVRPFAFWTAVSCLIIAAMTFQPMRGQFSDTLPGDIVAAVAALSAGLLIAGWWRSSQRLFLHGLLASSATWAATTAIIFIDLGWAAPSGWFAVCWTGAAAGAWIAEQPGMGRRRG